jgi:hypothetical protein
MGQRSQTLTQVLGYRGWRVVEASYERADGTKVTPVAGYDVPQELLFVLRTERRWAGRCAECLAICGRVHEQLPPRRWADLPWAGRPTVIEYAPQRLECRRCGHTGVELLAWADTHQRQTRRLQHYLAIETASMPVQHVAALHGLDWSTVKRAEVCALERWQKTRQKVPLRHVGIDEKYLGRRSRHRKEGSTLKSVDGFRTPDSARGCSGPVVARCIGRRPDCLAGGSADGSSVDGQ